MWRTIRAEQPLLSFDAYEEIGRLDGALAAHADKILDGLNETEQALSGSVRKAPRFLLRTPTFARY